MAQVVKQSAPSEQPLRDAQVILSYKIRWKTALGVYQFGWISMRGITAATCTKIVVLWKSSFERACCIIIGSECTADIIIPNATPMHAISLATHAALSEQVVKRRTSNP